MELYENPLAKGFELFNSLLPDLLGEGDVPRCRPLLIDYKDSEGKDYHQNVVAYQPQYMTDAAMVEELKKDAAQKGYTLSAICDVQTFQALYFRPGFVEESIRELGLPVPKNVAERIKAVGLNPVNMEELESGVKKSDVVSDAEYRMP